MLLLADHKLAYAEAALEDRCAPRTTLNIPAQLRPSGSIKAQGIIRNISISGFSCEIVSGMRPGTLCWLTLPGLAGLQAEVIWNNGQTVGCAFANLLNPAVLDRIIAQHQ